MRQRGDSHGLEAFEQGQNNFHLHKFLGGFDWSGPFSHSPWHGNHWWQPRQPAKQIEYRSFDGSNNSLSDSQLNAAGTESAYDVLRFGKTCHEDDGNACKPGFAFEAATGFESVYARHDGVEQNHVRSYLFADAQGRRAVKGDHDRHAGSIERIG